MHDLYWYKSWRPHPASYLLLKWKITKSKKQVLEKITKIVSIKVDIQLSKKLKKKNKTKKCLIVLCCDQATCLRPRDPMVHLCTRRYLRSSNSRQIRAPSYPSRFDAYSTTVSSFENTEPDTWESETESPSLGCLLGSFSSYSTNQLKCPYMTLRVAT